MKRLLLCLALAMADAMAAQNSAQKATISAHCLSLQFDPATARSLGIDYTLELLGGTPGSTTPNGELLLASPEAPTSHGSLFRLRSDIFPDPLTGTLLLDVPVYQDSNTNGLSDFYEISQPVDPFGSSGIFVDDLVGDQGTVTAVWSRAAGADTGACQLHLVSSFLNETFNATFHLRQWRGQLTYVPASGVVTGAVLMDPSLPLSSVVQGRAVFTIVNANHLDLQRGSWTNALDQTWSYLPTAPGEAIERDLKTYSGLIDFEDGEPGTPEPDYVTWVLLIDDPNDANGNGIPDLSDPVPVRVPVLSLRRDGFQLHLSVSGLPGSVCQLQQTPVLVPSQWTALSTVTLTNDPQTVDLSWPTNQSGFWRVRMP